MEELNHIKLQMSIAEGDLILKALGELPAKHSIGLISKIKTQTTPQIQAILNRQKNGNENSQ